MVQNDEERENGQGQMGAVDKNALIHIKEEIIRARTKLPCLLEAVRLAAEYDDMCSRCIVEKVTADAVEMGFEIRGKVRTACTCAWPTCPIR